MREDEMKQIITIIGARPQFVKAAVVSHAIKKVGAIEERILHTGQHYDSYMSDVFFEELAMPAPTWNLKVGSGPHGEQTGRMLTEIERILIEAKPSLVMVYGDTNSTLAGALAAAKLGIPVAHVEAGLRSFNRLMPEEINRIVTDRVSQLLFAPTKSAIQHLKREGFENDTAVKIIPTGDVMYDAFLEYSTRPPSEKFRSLNLDAEPYILVTVHRAENTDRRSNLAAILAAICQLKQRYRILFLVHPRTASKVKEDHELSRMLDSLAPHAPLGYLDMVHAEKNAAVIVTDSGGVQKEAYFAKIPCVTLRAETEWPETVASGWNRLVATASAEEIQSEVSSAIGTHGVPIDEYGDGRTSEAIAEELGKYLSR